MKKMIRCKHIEQTSRAPKARIVMACVLGGLLALPAHAALIAYYDFENDTQDSSGNGSHGTNNGVTFSTTVPSALSHSNKSGSFDGGTSGDHVDLGYLNLFTTAHSTGLTMSFWVRPDVASQAAWIIAEGNDTNGNTAYVWGARTQFDGKLNNFVRRDTTGAGNSSTFPSAQDAFLVGQWHHVLITDNAGAVTVYIDGVQDSNDLSYTLTGTYTFQNSSIGAWLRGASGGPTINNQFDGLIDDVAIYDEILGSAQIAALAGGANPIPEPSGSLLLALGGLGLVLRRTRR